MMKVLVVDDFADTRELIKLMLEMKGCLTVEAADGRQALDLATQEQPDLILMDLNMPVLDGWEATRRIRAAQGTCHIPVVAISAQCSGEWGALALAVGAEECLQKPIEPAAMDRVLSRHRSLGKV